MRPKSVNNDLPPNMIRQKGKNKKGKEWVAYYYYANVNGKRKKIPLGSDLNLALQKWAELRGPTPSTQAVDTNTFKAISRKYIEEVLPTKAPRTQKDYKKYLEKLLPVFGSMDIKVIRTVHLRQYLDRRKAKVRANREMALFSTIFNHAKQWGYVDSANPCAGLKKNRERPRDRYVTHVEFQAVWDKADDVLRDALDLAYLTGQRPADVLKMKLTDIQMGINEEGEEEETLFVQQNKTGAKLQIIITEKLSAVIERIKANRSKKSIISLNLLVNEKGEPLTFGALRSRFEKARAEAGVDFQFRDLRAKTATDSKSIADAMNLLGHTKESMTSSYRRRILGKKVKPTV